MSLLSRRQVAGTGAAAALAACAPALATSSPAPFKLTGTRQQGCLMIGKLDEPAEVMADGRLLNVSPEGLFAFGFAYDQTKPLQLSVIVAGGRRMNNEITPVVRKYEVQTITGLPQQTVTPSVEEQQRIEREHALVAEARKRNSDAVWFSEPFDWPANGIISGLFGSQRVLNGVASAPHFGVDIAAGEGAPVHAPANGDVLLAQEFFLEGNFTLLDHGHGVFTSYMHQSRLLVAKGDRVKRGQEIGLVGKTGRATGPHLHWGMNWFQVRLDPSLVASSPAPSKA